MNAAKQAIWLLLTLLTLACSGWYFAQSKVGGILDDETLSSTVDTTISLLILRQFNSDGTLAHYLTSPAVEHIPKQDIHIMKTPHIIVRQKDQPSWEIRANHAKSVEGGKMITFSKQVIILQNPGDRSQESILKTEEITYYPSEKKATSNLLVTFEQTGNIIESMGMNAYLDEKRVELLHKARGTYVPQKG